MDNMVKLVFVFFALMIVQGGMTFFQIKNYRKNAGEIRRKGDMLVGQAKGGLKPGCIVLMALDPEGNILETRSMLGRTVFNKFKVIHDFDGENVFMSEKWIRKIRNEQLKKAVKTGIATMKDQLEAKRQAELEERVEQEAEVTLDSLDGPK